MHRRRAGATLTARIFKCKIIVARAKEAVGQVVCCRPEELGAAAEIANEGITLEYDSGDTRTTLEVIQSRALLLNARIENAKAERDLVISKFKLYAKMKLLEFLKVFFSSPSKNHVERSWNYPRSHF